MNKFLKCLDSSRSIDLETYSSHLMSLIDIRPIFMVTTTIDQEPHILIGYRAIHDQIIKYLVFDLSENVVKICHHMCKIHSKKRYVNKRISKTTWLNDYRKIINPSTYGDILHAEYVLRDEELFTHIIHAKDELLGKELILKWPEIGHKFIIE